MSSGRTCASSSRATVCRRNGKHCGGASTRRQALDRAARLFHGASRLGNAAKAICGRSEEAMVTGEHWKTSFAKDARRCPRLEIVSDGDRVHLRIAGRCMTPRGGYPPDSDRREGMTTPKESRRRRRVRPTTRAAVEGARTPFPNGSPQAAGALRWRPRPQPPVSQQPIARAAAIAIG
jgi:hypothetical protein